MLWFEIPPGAFSLFAARGTSSLFPIKPASLQSRKPLCPLCLFTQLLLACLEQSHSSWDRPCVGNRDLALLITPGDKSATPCQAFLLPLFLFFLQSLKSTRNSHTACLTLQQNYSVFTHLILSSALNLSHLVMPEIPFL